MIPAIDKSVSRSRQGKKKRKKKASERRNVTYPKLSSLLLHLLDLPLILVELPQQLILSLLSLLARLESIEVSQTTLLLLLFLNQLFLLRLARQTILLRPACNGDKSILIWLLCLAGRFASAHFLNLRERRHVVADGAEKVRARRVPEPLVGGVSLESKRWHTAFDPFTPDDLGPVLGCLSSGFQTRFRAGFVDEDDNRVRTTLVQFSIPCRWDPDILKLAFEIVRSDALPLLTFLSETILGEGSDAFLLCWDIFKLDSLDSSGRELSAEKMLQVSFCRVYGHIDQEERTRRIGIGNSRLVRTDVDVMRRGLGK